MKCEGVMWGAGETSLASLQPLLTFPQLNRQYSGVLSFVFRLCFCLISLSTLSIHFFFHPYEKKNVGKRSLNGENISKLLVYEGSINNLAFFFTFYETKCKMNSMTVSENKRVLFLRLGFLLPSFFLFLFHHHLPLLPSERKFPPSGVSLFPFKT